MNLGGIFSTWTKKSKKHPTEIGECYGGSRRERGMHMSDGESLGGTVFLALGICWNSEFSESSPCFVASSGGFKEVWKE